MENAALPGYPGTRGLNVWEADIELAAAAGSRLTPPGRARAAEFGAFVGGTLDALIETAHKTENLPRLVDGAVRYCPEQIEARRHLARAIYGVGPLSLTERITRAVLANYAGEGGITCPLAMTEGLIGLLDKRGTDEQKKFLIPKLRSDDPEWALTGGQFITERQSGSNVAANETAATPNPDGTWSLAGTKWFCSNPGELWVTTAKTPRGVVALFLVKRKRADGSLNGHKILRLKPIGGTRGKATVEVEYIGAQAELIGKPREGLVLLVNDILSVSRLHVAAAALGFAGRAVLEARTFAAWRTAYGRPLTALASVAARLKSMQALHAGMITAFYRGLDALEENSADAEALVPLLKVEISRRGSALVREAQLLIGGHGILDDFSPLNRLADDALVNEIWEGTHPILAGHAAKSLRRPRVLDAFRKRVSKCADPAKLAGFSASVEKSRAWSEDERGLRDEELTAQAYLLLAVAA